MTKAQEFDVPFDENEVDSLDSYDDYPVGESRAAAIPPPGNVALEASKLIIRLKIQDYVP